MQRKLVVRERTEFDFLIPLLSTTDKNYPIYDQSTNKNDQLSTIYDNQLN